jgi:hypothetical protein
VGLRTSRTPLKCSKNTNLGACFLEPHNMRCYYLHYLFSCQQYLEKQSERPANVEAVNGNVSKGPQISVNIACGSKQIPDNTPKSRSVGCRIEYYALTAAANAQKDFLAVCCLTGVDVSRQLGTRQPVL